ncbi:thiamine pyrophosphate-dependent enzyme [Demequina sp. TTPB684]|uniref:thiamine pyrophosphate-dependent enzyme n=1 Tax=unclassified Demequina TaxID=2620311 RepID=UPI001CF16900|nr:MULTISPECIES: thiamine pyrophosphate-dependent enzyme [unclassified Demequina]MCB2412971.1 thiamine pyrophosphate-dependent enzyme [Demequina sp. TTPB684]UPU88341.1 thiamine pyrophosphate-binding protein [Demequina sp. TMPB413]
MSTTVAKHIITALADHGVEQVWGVVGDALNPLTDAIRSEERTDWVGVRHEEAAAFAVSAQAQATGRIGVCMGTVGPGSIHLLNGLYDAAKSHAPVLAIAGQVPTDEIGTNYFQEVDNDRLFANVAVWTHTLTSPAQLPFQLERAVNAAYERGGVAVLTIPGDIGMLEMSDDAPTPLFVRPTAPPPAPSLQVSRVAEALAKADKVTMLVGQGARHAREEVLAVAEALKAPMVVTLKGKTGLEGDNPYQVGQAGMLGNPAAMKALDACDVLLMVGTDFPYRESYPEGKTVIQIDSRSGHIGRRTGVRIAAVGDSRATLSALLERLIARDDDAHLASARKDYLDWVDKQQKLAHPTYDSSGIVAKVRSVFDNPDDKIRPEAVTALLNDLAPDDAVFTTDTGMSTVWAARFLEMRGSRELFGSFNLGSMANALPQALGVQALDRDRTVISLCGDGGLMMLLGDLRTAVTHGLPVKVVVLNNGSLGMVRLEQEEGGMARFGTGLDNPDLAAVGEAMGLASRRIERPEDLEEGVRWAMDHDGPALIDVVTNPSEIAVPPGAGVSDAWGFAIAKVTEAVESAR